MKLTLEYIKKMVREELSEGEKVWIWLEKVSKEKAHRIARYASKKELEGPLRMRDYELEFGWVSEDWKKKAAAKGGLHFDVDKFVNDDPKRWEEFIIMIIDMEKFARKVAAGVITGKANDLAKSSPEMFKQIFSFQPSSPTPEKE